MNNSGPEVVHDTNTAGMYLLWCTGCVMYHQIYTAEFAGRGPKWSFDGDKLKPTFTPSLRVRWQDETGDNVCHSFIERGYWRYLPDCTHDLVGQTVRIVEGPG